MKEAKKMLKKIKKVKKKFRTKNWLYGFYCCCIFNLITAKTSTKVLLMVALFTVLNYIVTKNLTSAMGGVIVATACMYFNHLQEKLMKWLQ